ncbi:MAG: 4Fe-4S dicluster domain-containing protein [Proteobacteria bacterium]|nr:4Fe-4S dicluster domain-containing protein [Pseudomonadota bacterium]
MAYVVTENCKNCMFTDCVEVCPVDCFYGDETMIYIHPDECIDCGACEPACPVEAIFPAEDVAEDQEKWIDINAEKCEEDGIENITEARDPLEGADERKTALGF